MYGGFPYGGAPFGGNPQVSASAASQVGTPLMAILAGWGSPFVVLITVTLAGSLVF